MDGLIPEKQRVATQDCCGSREMTVVEALRSKSKELHERAVNLDKLADKLEHSSVDHDNTLRYLVQMGLRM